MEDSDEFTRTEIVALMEICYRAGFIQACQWSEPVSQDIDSGAFHQLMVDFIDGHNPFEVMIDLTNHSES